MIRCIHCGAILENVAVAICGLGCAYALYTQYAIRAAVVRSGIGSSRDIYRRGPL